MEGLRTGELAIQGGVNLETIRYYERRGLLRSRRVHPPAIARSMLRPCVGCVS